jgi:hypothetical protein
MFALSMIATGTIDSVCAHATSNLSRKQARIERFVADGHASDFESFSRQLLIRPSN